MSTAMPVEPQWLAARNVGKPIGVDRENKVIRGYVVAQRGPFKSAGRGQFTDESLQRIAKLMGEKSAGLKSRFAHPSMSSDGVGSFLGRAKNGRVDGDKVRADLHLDPSSFNTPNGNLGGYVLDLAESDPDALSSSLVLQTEKVQILDEKGRPKVDDKGEEIPPIWLPTKLHASDVVDTGDAVDGFLSADANLDVDGLPMGALWRGCEALDRLFAGQTRDVVEARVSAWLGRYLSMRFGEPADVVGADDVQRLQRRLRAAEMARKHSGG